MARLRWSPRAATDLQEICEFISRDSDFYARTFAQRIVAVIENLPDFPRSGRVVPEYNNENIRERIFQNYRIVYRVLPDTIEIVAIVHAARMMPDL